MKKLPFEVVSGAAIWRPLPPIEYFIDGFLPRGCLGMICAFGESHKSWMLVDLAIAVASGRPWLQRFAARRGRVLYMDYENNEDETRRRIIGLHQTPIEGLDIAIMPDLFMTDKNFRPEIESIFKQYDFIAIDSLCGGSQDVSENDTKFAQSLRHIKRAAAKTGGAAVVLHHSRKPSRDKDGDDVGESDRRHKPRGTSAIFAALDALLDVESISDSESSVAHTKKRGPVKLESFTVRISGSAPEPTSLIALSKADLAHLNNQLRLRKLFERYDKVMGAKPMTGADLIRLAGRRKQDGLKELKELVLEKYLVFDETFYARAGSRGSRPPEPQTPVELVPKVPKTRNLRIVEKPAS